MEAEYASSFVTRFEMVDTYDYWITHFTCTKFGTICF